MPPKHTPFAIIYDFDGTLASGNLQENSFIPNIGMDAKDFWREVNEMAKLHQADPILIYMYLMLEKARSRVPVRLDDFKRHGSGIDFFPGVEEWFDRLSSHGKDMGVKLDHYIVSSGNAEIIEGTSIGKNFKAIYASRFMFDENGVARWPAQAINFTTKTQFLFRINKGARDLSDSSKINSFVEKEKRPMRFENMVYIGDGETDVPCFRLVKDQGGLSVAVYESRKNGAQTRAKKFLAEDRVHSIAPADYSEGKDLDTIVKAQIDYVAAREKRVKSWRH